MRATAGSGDLPVRQFVDRGVESRLQKIFPVSIHPKSLLELFASHPERGAYHDRHETRGGMRWTRQRFARDGIAGRVLLNS